MNSKLEWWNKKHQKYANEDWIDKPSLFAQWAIHYFPLTGKVLELGAGHGQDSRYFADLGYAVTSTDFSDVAIQYNHEKIPPSLRNLITVQRLDITPPLPFTDDSFDVIYCHLSTHFFDQKTTEQLFSEFYRILSQGGILAILENSTDDPEYGSGTKIEKDFFELTPGDIKRFFSIQSMKNISYKFAHIILDNQGETYKDNAKNVYNLIRFIGKKF